MGLAASPPRRRDTQLQHRGQLQHLQQLEQGSQPHHRRVFVIDRPATRSTRRRRPSWTLCLEGFDGYALKILNDGRITIGGQEGDVAMIDIVDPAGALLSGHTIDPMPRGRQRPPPNPSSSSTASTRSAFPYWSLAAPTTSTPPTTAFLSSTFPQARPDRSSGPPSSPPATAHPHRTSSSNPAAALHSYPVSARLRSPPPDDNS